MPGTIEKQKSVCTDYLRGGDICANSNTVTYDEKNDYKVPALFSGMALVTVALAFGEKVPDTAGKLGPEQLTQEGQDKKYGHRDDESVSDERNRR